MFILGRSVNRLCRTCDNAIWLYGLAPPYLGSTQLRRRPTRPPTSPFCWHRLSGSASSPVDDCRQPPGFLGGRSTDLERPAGRRDICQVVMQIKNLRIDEVFLLIFPGLAVVFVSKATCLLCSVRVSANVQRWISAGKPSLGSGVQTAAGAWLWSVFDAARQVETVAPPNGHRNRKSPSKQWTRFFTKKTNFGLPKLLTKTYEYVKKHHFAPRPEKRRFLEKGLKFF